MAEYTLEEQKALKAIDEQLLRVADGTLSAVGFIDFVADIITESNKTATAAEEVVDADPLAPLEALVDERDTPGLVREAIGAALAEARETVDALVKKWEVERESHTSALEKVMHLTERAEVAEAERERVIRECEKRAENAESLGWARGANAYRSLARFARGEDR